MMPRTVTITMKPIRFYSSLDEQSLLRNLNLIQSIVKFNHIDRGLEIFVDFEKLDWENLKDILSLFIRYKCDINEICKILFDENVKNWFLSSDKDWHKCLNLQ